MVAVTGELRYVDSVITSVIEDIDSTFILKEEQRTANKAFTDRKDVFFRPSLWDSTRHVLHCSDYL